MKVKRLVSLLLATMLLIGMIPLGALAALTPSTIPQQTKDDLKVKFDLKVVNTVGGTYTYNGEQYTITEANYKNGRTTGNGNPLGDVYNDDTQESTLEAAIKLAESPVFNKAADGTTSGPAETMTGLKAGDKFYLCLKATAVDATEEFGLFNYVVNIKFDTTRFKSTATQQTAAAIANTFIANPIASGKTPMDLSAEAVSPDGSDGVSYEDAAYAQAVAYTKKARKYVGDCALESSYGYQKGQGNDGYLQVSFKSNGAAYIPSATAWDVVIPMQVQAGASGGTSAFEVVPAATLASGTKTGTQLSVANGLYDGVNSVNSTTHICAKRNNEAANVYQLNGSTEADAAKLQCGKIDIGIVSNDTSFSITGGAAVPNGGEADVVVAAENCTFKAYADATAVGANWTATATATGTGAGATISKVTPGADGKTATVHLTGITKGTGDGTFTIAPVEAAVNVEAGKTFKAPDNLKLTVVSVPAASLVTYVGGKLQIAGDTDGDVKYSIDGGENWSSAKGTSAAPINLTTADETALRAKLKAINPQPTAASGVLTYDDALLIAYEAAATKGSTAVTKVPVKVMEEPTVPVAGTTAGSNSASPADRTMNLDYEGEKLYIGKGLSATVGGSAVDASTAVKTSDLASGLAAGVKVKAKALGTTTAMDSAETAEQTYKASATPTGLSSTDAVKVDGKTRVTGAKAGMQYMVGTAANWTSPTTVQASDIVGGNLDIVARATSGNKIFFRVPGSNTNKTFASAAASVDAKGNTAGTITVTAPAFGGTTVVLKVQGAEFASNVSSIDVTNASGTSVKTAVNKDSDTQVTITVQAAAEDTFTVSVPAAALNPAESPLGTLTYTVSDKGYKIVAGTKTHNGGADGSSSVAFTADKLSGLQPSANKTVDLTFSGLEDYEKLEASSFTITGKASIAPKAGDTTGLVWTLTLTGSDVTSGTEDIKIDVNTKINPKEITDAKMQVGSKTKAYDGTADIDPQVSFNFGEGDLYTGKTNITVALKAGGKWTLSQSDVGTGLTITSDKAFEITGDDAAYYTLADNLTKAYTITGAEITAKAISAVTVEGSDTKVSASQANVIKAIKDMTVKGDGATLGTLGDLAAADTDWAAMADAAMIAAGYLDGDKLTADFSAGTSATLDAAKPGDIITVTLPEGLKVKADGAYTLNEDGTITLKTGTTSPVTIKTEDESGTAGADQTLTITQVNDPVADYKAVKADGTITVTVPAATLKSMAANLTNYSGIDGITADATATVNVKKSGGSTPVGPVGPTDEAFTVTYLPGDHGTIISGADSLTVNKGEKPESKPTVMADNGWTFLGWSRDGVKTIDPLNVAITADTTYTAIYTRGFMDGDGNGKVWPTNDVTRAEFTKMVVTAFHIYDPQEEYDPIDFTDVKDTSWYAPYIACAVQNDIVHGYDNGKFAPTAKISREEAAQIICNAYEGLTEYETTDKISDLASAHNWAHKAISTLVENGIITGYDDGTFRPLAMITRGEAATMISRLVGFDPTDEEKADIKANTTSAFQDLSKNAWYYSYVMFANGALDDSWYE